MVNEKTGYILLVIGVLGLAAILLTTTFMASVISEEDHTYEIAGATKKCGNYYDTTSYISDYRDFIDFCETEGYQCFEDSREGSFGTIYEFDCDDLCYFCQDGKTYSALVSGSCEEEGLEDVSDEDSVEYFEAFSNEEREEILESYCEEPVETTCYQCDGSDIEEKVVEGETCPSGWTEDWQSLDCEEEEEEVPIVRCYQCDDSGNVVSDSFEESCPSGWSREEPDCVEIVECYKCQDGEIITSSFEGECPAEWSSEQPTDCESEEMVKCYACKNGETITSEFPESCPEEWSDEPVDCNTLDKIIIRTFDFKQNTASAIVATLSSIAAVSGLFIVVSRSSRKKEK